MSSRSSFNKPYLFKISRIAGMRVSGICEVRRYWVRLFLSTALLVAVSGCQLVDMAQFTFDNAKSTHQWANDQYTTTIPFTLIDNHIVLPVRVNGSDPLSFVLDSGAGATVITDSRSSRALGLEMDGQLTIMDYNSRNEGEEYVINNLKELDTQNLTPLEALNKLFEMKNKLE